MNMKNIFRRSAALLLLVSAAAPSGFCANMGSPQEVNLKITEFWISPNADCTGLTRIYNDPSAGYQNMVAGANFGQLGVANGTYQCIAWKMSDVITLKPDYTSDGGQCVQGTTYTRDLFRNGDVAMAPDGTVINGTASIASPDGMWIYLSTTGNDNPNSGTVPSQPGILQNAYVVQSNSRAVMVADFTNGIHDLGSECSPEEVRFGFRYTR